MNFDNIKRIVFDLAKDRELEEYEIFYTSDSSISAETLGNEVSAFNYGVSSGICFRCIIDGKIGAASTELIEEGELSSLVDRAISNAKNIESDDPAVIFGGSEHYETLDDDGFSMPSALEIKNDALKLQKMTYSQSEHVTDGTQSYTFAGEAQMNLVNSYGLDLSNKYGVLGSYVQAVVKRDGEAQECFEAADEIDPNLISDMPGKAVEGALSKIGAGLVPSGKYDIVFSAKQARALLSTFVSVFSARNAQLGLSLLAGKEGEKIASDIVSITDDPMRDGCRVRTTFDGEGVATYKKTVIEKGRLNTLLYDITTAQKAGKHSTANGQRAAYSDPVTIEPYSFYINAGEKTLDELFATAGDGIYVTAMKGLHAGADAVTGDFSIECEGFRIRDGKKAEALKSFTVAGNFFELLKNIEDISCELSFGLPSGFTVFGAPDLLVRQMSVAGE